MSDERLVEWYLISAAPAGEQRAVLRITTMSVLGVRIPFTVIVWWRRPGLHDRDKRIRADDDELSFLVL